MIDVEVARTFLAVIETGTFQGAADKVHVTQSTVSARIRTLEDRLGQRVFARSKAGARLTSHGYHFERYARTIVRAWEQGRQQAGIPETFDDMLILGGQYNLWARFLSQALVEMQEQMTNVAFKAEAGTPLALSRLLSEGLLDIAVLHQPRLRTDIAVEHLMDDDLIMVTTDPKGEFEDRYVYVDWGEEYRDRHAQILPKLMEPRTTVALGFFGPSFLIASEAA
ncbi:MAG TPA: LysR family transcriptional regulator, partial [Hyphomonas sp.]|nr:LysR family transcriptional regulator [Hyphomonas sp.]HBL93233.1 LysR family transcriptional regulator [Hyphomonas sp.]HCJ19349.1 LysR family transcriptional regulator [Hyphomonas sp.]